VLAVVGRHCLALDTCTVMECIHRSFVWRNAAGSHRALFSSSWRQTLPLRRIIGHAAVRSKERGRISFRLE
jgi:hypothetical protein